MKIFVDGRMMVTLFCVFILLGANVIVADSNGLFEVETSRKTNLRRSLESEQHQLGGVRLASTTKLRHVEEKVEEKEEATDAYQNETEELENIENEFAGDTNDNAESENETEELENIENEFAGDIKDNAESENETEGLENIENEFAGDINDNGESENETDELENIENEFAGDINDNGESENETDELENIEKEFGGEVTESETEELENIENEFDGVNKNGLGTSEEKQWTLTAEETGNIDNTGNDEAEKETPVTNQPTEAPKPETRSPVESPTMKPTVKPYTAKDDQFDPVKAEDEKHAEEEEVQELETELKQEEKVARRAGGLGIFFGILVMIFTAHQMSENPDGIYASVCRLAITISTVVVKIVCMPCRKMIGAGGSGNPYSGHMPISTSDYSYRNDPYRSNANAGFEMS